MDCTMQWLLQDSDRLVGHHPQTWDLATTVHQCQDASSSLITIGCDQLGRLEAVISAQGCAKYCSHGALDEAALPRGFG